MLLEYSPSQYETLVKSFSNSISIVPCGIGNPTCTILLHSTSWYCDLTQTTCMLFQQMFVLQSHGTCQGDFISRAPCQLQRRLHVKHRPSCKQWLPFKTIIPTPTPQPFPPTVSTTDKIFTTIIPTPTPQPFPPTVFNDRHIVN
jgi:hypothetical protein